MTLSGRFAVLVALGIVPVVAFGRTLGAGMTALGAWALLCLAALLVDLALAGDPRRVALSRDLPARVRLGEAAPSTLLVTNLSRRMLRLVVRDAWTPSAGASTGRIALQVPPGERRAARLTLTPTRRGERRVETATLRAAGPFGLAARQATLVAPGAIRVLPPFLSRRHLPSRLARLRELDGRTAVLIRGQGTEFDALREYVPGDDVRSIDWRATARRGDDPGWSNTAAGPRLMVRTWRPERDRRIVIVVDTSRTSAARVADEPRLDTAIESALLLSALADRAGDRVDLLAYDQRTRARVHGATGASLLQQEVDALATVEPELIEMDWAAVPGQLRALTSRRALVVLLTSIDSAGASRGLLSVLPQLTARHAVMVASVADPVTVDAARRLGSLDEVYRAAAAERALLDASRVSAAVARQGAHVVTGTPAELPVAVVDAYLALKAAGRL